MLLDTMSVSIDLHGNKGMKVKEDGQGERMRMRSKKGMKARRGTGGDATRRAHVV
jgi:hypothetical protein